MLALLSEQSAGQQWWLGYLDTGAGDIVFPGAPMVTLYFGWHYVLVEAGPEQAASWRLHGPWTFRCPGPAQLPHPAGVAAPSGRAPWPPPALAGAPEHAADLIAARRQSPRGAMTVTLRRMNAVLTGRLHAID